MVEVGAGPVDRPRAGGLDPGPRDREPVGLQAQLREECDVLEVAVVVVRGDLVVGGPLREVGPGVDDGGAVAPSWWRWARVTRSGSAHKAPMSVGDAHGAEVLRKVKNAAR